MLMAGRALAKTAPSDSWITTKVKMQLLTTDDVSGIDVNVDTTDGVVTLQGPVSDQGERDRTIARAKSVDGVRGVRDLLEIVPPAHASVIEAKDDAIHDQVSRGLLNDQALIGSSISIKSVTNGAVILGGSAKTLGAHAEAIRVARSVPGVRKVVSEIKSPDTLGDEDLWHPAAKEALKSDAKDAANAVDKAEKKPTAEAKDAQKDTAAEAKTASGSAADGWITTKAKMALWASSDVSSNDVSVDTRNGVVTLFGTVPSESVRDAAVTKVRGLDGVRDVKNQLQVVAKASEKVVDQNDDAIKTAVQDRMKERDDLRAAKLDVSVAKGVVKLTGPIPSQEERLTALSVARSTAGVRSVIDEMQVRVD